MNNLIKYKGYIGSVEIAADESMFCGKVQGIQHAIQYEGYDAEGFIGDFHGKVDAYLQECLDAGVKPEKAYKGSFNVRLTPELHERAVIYAMHSNMPLNTFVEQAVQEKLQKVR